MLDSKRPIPGGETQTDVCEEDLVSFSECTKPVYTFSEAMLVRAFTVVVNCCDEVETFAYPKVCVPTALSSKPDWIQSTSIAPAGKSKVEPSSCALVWNRTSLDADQFIRNVPHAWV